MARQDRFLAVIVIGIVLLVAAAVVVSLTRPEPEYAAGTAPADIVHNYLLALQLEEYDLALTLLDPRLPGLPMDSWAMREDVMERLWEFHGEQQVGLEVLSADVSGGRADVKVQEIRFYRNGLFGSSESVSIFSMGLSDTEEGWKISKGDRYWAACWETARGC